MVYTLVPDFISVDLKTQSPSNSSCPPLGNQWARGYYSHSRDKKMWSPGGKVSCLITQGDTTRPRIRTHVS